MNTYGFTVAHGYEVLKGYVQAESKQQTRWKIVHEDWGDIIDSYNCDVLTEGYEVLEVWECD